MENSEPIDATNALAESRAECLRLEQHLAEAMAQLVQLDNAEARAERLEEALQDARDYVTSELSREREAFKGHENCSGIPAIEADLAAIDAALKQEPKK